MNIESNNQNFKLDEFLKVQEGTRKIVEEVIQKVQVGMNAKDIENLISHEMKNNQFEKSWHPSKVRIDGDTNLLFREKSDESIKLTQGSICFIDIGTIKNDYEGDVGRSFVMGKNQVAEDLINKCEDVFMHTVCAWREENLTGEELYKFAQTKSLELGVELNLSMDGHRIGSFPHGVYFKGGLAEIDITPDKNCWILEIQVKCPKLEKSAFYEDLIY